MLNHKAGRSRCKGIGGECIAPLPIERAASLESMGPQEMGAHTLGKFDVRSNVARISMKRRQMMDYEFTIIAHGLDHEAVDFEARFYDGGCDDALVSFQKGHILIDFAREAESLEQAIASAIENVRQIGAIVDRVEPDPLVSLSDIASRAEMSRAAISHYFQGKRGEGFPAPKARVTTSSPLWDWSEVSLWLYQNERVERTVATNAAVIAAANFALECDPGDFQAKFHERAEESLALI